MDDNAWDKIRRELATPWDWVAAGLGAAGGLGATFLLHGSDGGTAAGIGALAAVSARKAGDAAFRGRKMARRANGLMEILQERIDSERRSPLELLKRYVELLEAIRRDQFLWEKKVIDNDQFDALLNRHTEAYRQLP